MPNRLEDAELDIREDSDGWDDIEDDSENISIQCLVCDDQFAELPTLLNHQKSRHALDVQKVKEEFDLDFYGLIRFVNYVRSYQMVFGRASGQPPDVSDEKLWADEGLLQPVIKDDALLFCLDELDNLEVETSAADTPRTSPAIGKGKSSVVNLPASTAAARIKELEAELARVSLQFRNYREQVAATLDARWNASAAALEDEASMPTISHSKDNSGSKADIEYDHSYFSSYGTLGIHHAMLSDTIRTDAYRDFTYENKALFKDKVIMDVGCGTGILSLFAAKAGAKKVIAIDNSSIIERARQIVQDNDLTQVIHFHHGKVEDLSADQVSYITGGRPDVDLIVSEWMGYCLLFEAMLPSVLHARDKFLKRSTKSPGKFEGIMAPSHCEIHIAPLSDEQFIADNVDFWRDVYGFDYNSLREGSVEDVFIDLPKPESIVGKAVTATDKTIQSTRRAVKTFNLYDVTVEDLSFTSPFSIHIDNDSKTGFDGWCLWFDILFSPLAAEDVPEYETIEHEFSTLTRQTGAVKFSTSPYGKATHWQSGLCVIDRGAVGNENPPEGNQLNAGDMIEGSLEFRKGRDGRDLELFVEYKGNKRRWFVR